MSGSTERPNILFIMADQFRGDVMGCVGGPARTPNLDRLAQEGVCFTNCCTVAPLCVPARISMMTGQYPHTTGAWDNAPYVLSPEAPMWSKVIRAQGYNTSVFGKLHLHTDFGDVIAREPIVRGYGFDTVDETSGPHASCRARTHMGELWKTMGLWEDYCNDMPSRGKTPRAKPSPLPLEAYYDVYVGRRSREYLEQYNGEEPWLCHVSFGGPHEPWDTPEPYASLYKREKLPAPLPAVRDRVVTRPRGEYDRLLETGELRCGAETAREIRADYYGGVTLIDELIGGLVETVKRRGEWDRTAVLFTSDHGELNGDHGLVNKRNFFRPVLNVPLIVRTPETARKGGRLCEELVSLLDVGPTLAELSGGELDYLQFGQSLLPRAAGLPSCRREYILSEYAGEIMYMDRQWKLVANRHGEPYQMFHLAEDPEELENLAGAPEYREQETVLERRLFRAVAENRRLKPAALQMPEPSTP